MKKLFALLFLSGIFSGSLSAEGKHLFILSGQSNMAALKPEISFTPAVAEAFGEDNITVVKDAQNGAPIRAWVYNYEYPDKRELKGKNKDYLGSKYNDLITAVKTATEGKTYDSVTFIWMQGERDAKESLSEVYAKSFKAILDQLKKDLSLKEINFVLGRISDFDMTDKSYPHWTKIREIQMQIAEADPKGAWVDTDEMNGGGKGTSGGGLHYSGSGYKALGQRFAEEAIALINKN
jgi:hypothetical protein